MEEKYNRVKEILKKYNQEQLLFCYDKFIEAKKEELLDQILAIDFEHMKQLYEETKENKSFKNIEIEPLPYIDKFKLSDEKINRYEDIGTKIIRDGK